MSKKTFRTCQKRPRMLGVQFGLTRLIPGQTSRAGLTVPVAFLIARASDWTEAGATEPLQGTPSRPSFEMGRLRVFYRAPLNFYGMAALRRRHSCCSTLAAPRRPVELTSPFRSSDIQLRFVPLAGPDPRAPGEGNTKRIREFSWTVISCVCSGCLFVLTVAVSPAAAQTVIDPSPHRVPAPARTRTGARQWPAGDQPVRAEALPGRIGRPVHDS